MSGNYFAALGVTMTAGRPIVATDDTAAAEPVAVLGSSYWRQRFNSDPEVIGRTPQIIINPFGASALQTPSWWWVQIMGRLRPGVSLEQVAAQFSGPFQQSVEEVRGERGAGFTPILGVSSGSHGLNSSRERYAPAIAILVGLMALVLFVACANAASLLLTRAASRQREIATRRSVGATDGRLVRQLLIESVLLALLSGALGVLLAAWGKDLLLQWGPWSIQAEQVVTHVDWRVLGFAFAVSLGTGVLFGVLPALRAVRSGNEAASMETGIHGSSQPSRAGRLLLVGQLAVSLVLLVGAGLFVQTVWNLKRVDLGFDPSNLLLFRVDPALNRYEPARFVATVESMIGAVRATRRRPRRDHCRAVARGRGRQLQSGQRHRAGSRGARRRALELLRRDGLADRGRPGLWAAGRPGEPEGRGRERDVPAGTSPTRARWASKSTAATLSAW